jgi:chemotaxis protein MotA
MNIFTIFGLFLGFGAVILGNIFEGGHTASLIQGSAFFIVMGGTLGAVLVSHQKQNVKYSIKLLKLAFRERSPDKEIIRRMTDYSRLIKKEGPLALESKLSKIKDSWEQDALKLVIDGTSAENIRSVFDIRIDQYRKQISLAAKVWMDAGGFAPTIGILGAVLGLIHVMGNLSDTSKLGAGIAVAFVATIYGVGFSNLLFLPLGNKIKAIGNEQVKEKEMLIEGVIALAEDLNTIVLEMKMNSYQDQN